MFDKTMPYMPMTLQTGLFGRSFGEEAEPGWSEDDPDRLVSSVIPHLFNQQGKIRGRSRGHSASHTSPNASSAPRALSCTDYLIFHSVDVERGPTRCREVVP